MELTTNIICNNCVGAQLCKALNPSSAYPNPFMWTHIDSDDFKILVNQWNDINFYDVHIIVKDKGYPRNGGVKVYGVLIDNKIHVYFPHMIPHEGIETDILNKYHRRVDRMMACKIPPTFIFIERGACGEKATEENIKDLMDMIYRKDLILGMSHPKVTASNIFQCAPVHNTAYIKDADTIKRIFYSKS